MIIIAMESKNGDTSPEQFMELMDALDRIAKWRVFQVEAPLSHAEAILVKKKPVMKKKGLIWRILQIFKKN